MDILQEYLNQNKNFIGYLKGSQRRLIAENTESYYLEVLEYAKKKYKTNDIYQEIKKKEL